MERRLAAIFSTDVKGYSRLMGDDEEATIHTLKTYREVITNLIEQHHGRVVDSPGDNMLAEFASAVDAVKSAVAIQHELKTRNADLEAHRQMEFRIGLNVGDVITDEGRLYGDGVNIAARLEGLADPGGICISGNVHEQVRNKLAVVCEYIGEQTVKNIATPVSVYKVQLESDGRATTVASPKPSAPRPVQEPRPARRWSIAALAVAVLGVAAGVLTLWDVSPPLSPPAGTESVADNPALPLPDKPSIAVLPLTNMSGDPEQEYFSDGITETLITDLSKISGLFVIASNSTSAYKGTQPSHIQVRRELGVRYLLEGSVQKAGEQVRISTQLIDTDTGGHVWAERYDRELTDLFVVQDEITREIVQALEVKLTAGEQERVFRRTTGNLDAYEAYVRGNTFALRFTPEAIIQARQGFERAIELDPQYADAYADLGWTYYLEWVLLWNLDPQVLEQAFRLVQEALRLDDTLPNPHLVMGLLSQWRHQYDQALDHVNQALTLDPNFALAYAGRAQILNGVGQPAEAVDSVQQAMRLNPRYTGIEVFYLGQSYRLLGRYEEAITTIKESLRLTPDFLYAYTELAMSYIALGREEEARAAVAEVLRVNPQFSLEVFGQTVPYKDPTVQKREITSLRKAGLK